jgi:predicted alpha/beta hydrolase
MFISETIKTKDGRKIKARIYVPDEEARRVIVISASAAVTQEFYFEIACFFRQNNFAVVSFDFRGTGDSAPPTLKGYKASLANWALQDTDAVLLYTKTHFPKHELIFIGHGIGGEIIGLTPASQFINRIILVNSALSCSRLRRWSERIWIGGMKGFVKVISWLFGYFPGEGLKILKNLPKGVMYEWVHWCNNVNGLFDEFSDHNYRRLEVPLLAFSFSDDWRSQETSVKALLEHFASACITWYHINPKQLNQLRVGHSNFFKTRFKKNLWDVLLNWINDKKCEESEQFSLTKKPFDYKPKKISRDK